MINFSLISLITNQFFLLFMSIGLGLIIGNIKIRKFKFGTSGVLFMGLFLSWFVNYAVRNVLFNNSVTSELLETISQNLVQKNIFIFSLILFIASTGLVAGANFISIIKRYGVLFPIMALVITTGGYFSAKILKHSFKLDSNVTTGVFAGSLTSSPGLGTALENAEDSLEEADIGLGYALAYVPGVLAVIFAMYLIPSFFNIDVKAEKKELSQLVDNEEEIQDKIDFDFKSFALVVIVGLMISKIKMNLGPIQDISLGITGGTLVSALIFGVVKKFWVFNFQMKVKQLKFLQKMGLLLFLASIGLRYGYIALDGFNAQSLIYFLVAFTVTILSILIGFLIGRYIFKMNWIVLSGAICGGMTSTPGIGAAVEAIQTDEVVASYGAVYPFALFGMVLLLVIGL